MSKKTAIILSVILFAALVVLLYCERRWPEEGIQLLGGILGN